MGSLPREEAGVGSASSDTAMQVGGALGVAVLGTALTLRYQRLMGPVVARAPAAAQGAIKSSIGGALAVAQQAPRGRGGRPRRRWLGGRLSPEWTSHC